MFKSQIKKAITTAYLKGTPHKCHSFPNTPEGIELLKAYLLSQFKYPFGMVMELDVVHTPEHQCNSKSGVNWDVSYVIRNGNFASISERIFRLYGTDTHINVPRKFPRLTREYVLKDIRDDGLTLHSTKALDHPMDESIVGILRKPTYANELPKSPSGLHNLYPSFTDSNPDHISQDQVDTHVVEEKSRPTRIYGENVGHAEASIFGSLTDTADFTGVDIEKHKQTLADTMSEVKSGMKVVDKNGWKGVHGYSPSLTIRPNQEEMVEREIKKLKDKYPEIPEEELRSQLENMIKE